MGSETNRLVLVWVALMVLLALTAASCFVPLGAWNNVVNLAIALAKALLVALFFMRLARTGPLPRMVAFIALGTLALLLALSGADYATRRMFRAPWTAPPAGQTQAARTQAARPPAVQVSHAARTA
jgi:cytochrome c oxidase subunit 4